MALMSASAVAAPAPTSSMRNRRYKRAVPPPDFNITWQVPGIREITAGREVNVGGVFVVTEKVQPEGTNVKIKIPNSGGDIPVSGIVRNTAPNGMGVEFVAIGNKERLRLDSLVKKFLMSVKQEDALRRTGTPGSVAAASSAPSVTAPPAAATQPATEARAPKKRKHARINLPRGLKVAWTFGKQSELTIAGTVSIGGLFVLSDHPAPVGSSVRLLFDIPGGEVLATATVRNHVAGRGMGVEFTDIRPEDRARLDQLLDRLMS